ncbi:biopolymer transporter ExbD [bacterium]|nr:biopolymer transporter ExbD [bacterium]
MAGPSFGGDGDDYTPVSEMNMVPFIDVMLVLLIISMVTTPFLEQGVNVELPVAGGQSLQKQVSEQPIILYVSKNENLRIGDTPVSRNALAKELAKLFKGRDTKELFVRADKAVPYGVVAEIMSEVQSAGIERVGLVTQPQ